MIPHCRFGCIFLIVNGVEHFFMCLLLALYVFGEMSVHIFCSFFDWLVFLISSYMSCLCILEVNPLSVALFAVIFSHSGLSFHLVYGFLCCAEKLFSLIRSNLFIFVLILF